MLAYVCIFIGLIFNLTQCMAGILFYAAMVGFIISTCPSSSTPASCHPSAPQAGLIRTRTTTGTRRMLTAAAST